jgi:anti-sigma28 factor (negative regulator of flagellin synthesis)
MVNDPDYRLYLEQRFNGIVATINAQFINVNDTLDAIKEQTIKTNSRVNHLEDDVRKIQINEAEHLGNCPAMPKIETIEKDVMTIREARVIKNEIKNGELKVKADKRADTQKVLQLIATVIAAVGLSITAWNSFKSINHDKDMKTGIDLINTPVRSRDGGVYMIPSGVLVDSLKTIENVEKD